MSLKIMAAVAIALSMLCGPAMAQEYFSPGQSKKQEQPTDLPNFDLMTWFKKSVEDAPDIAQPSNTLVTTCTDMTLTATIAATHTVQSVLFIVDSWAPDERLTGVAAGNGTWTVDWVMPCDQRPDHNYKVKILAIDSRGEYTVAVQWIFLRS
jgi:hypothetical protein